MEHLEDFKKSFFITISRFYYPQMPPQQLSKANLQKFHPALCTNCSLWGKGSSPAALKAYGIADLPHPLFEAESLSDTKMLC